MWSKFVAKLAKSSREWEIVSAVKSLIENNLQYLDKLVSFSRQDLMQTFRSIHSTVPKYNISGLTDLTPFQMCQRLVLVVNALMKTEVLCAICDKSYTNDFESLLVVRCSECCISAHDECTSNLYLPQGFYWKCLDCDEQSKPLNRIVQSIREAINSHSNGVSVKSEPFSVAADEESPQENCEEFEEDDIDEEEEETCYPQKGFLCDLCSFSTFDFADFQAHLDVEEQRFSLVQNSIFSPDGENTCMKCHLKLESSSQLFIHVTKFHSRPSDFPQFGDMEWKYLMSWGNFKRSCSYCGEQFATNSEWISHMKTNMGEDQEEDLKCTDCDPEQLFKSHDALRIHNSTFHRRNKRFLCAFCPFDGSSVKDLNAHINQDHEGNFNRCNECDFETWAHSVLRRHINIKHRKIKNFKCKHCSFEATTKSTLTAHQIREHNEEKSAPHLATAEFKCCFCDFKTTSKKFFQEHFDQDHEGNRTQCLECDFKAPVISHLRRHIDSVHRGLKKYPCDSCDHRATTKQGLERHVRVRHINLKDLKCPHCEYRTSAPDALRSHAKKYHEVLDDDVKKEPKKRIYFGNRQPIPMVCRLCGEGAPTTNKLAAHFADCHPFEKPFWCHQCNIGYETYYGIQNHNRKDHSEERHLCPICGYSTHGPQYLKRHYRRKHPHMFDAMNAQQKDQTEDKISADEKMKVALELKGLSDEEISERVKALIELSEDGVWTCAKCRRRFEGKPKRALYSHIRERHFHMRHFKCKECNFLSYNRAEIQEHKEKHKADKPIHQCDLCGFICDNSTGLIRHKRGRFCQNGHLQRRKRDREKMAKRMAMAFSASDAATNDHEKSVVSRIPLQEEGSANSSIAGPSQFPYGPQILY